MSNVTKINASPRKSFFIDLLTRDITLSHCILDLIDNSIDWILRLTKIDMSEVHKLWWSDQLKKFYINIEYNENYFSIEDNGSWIDEKILTEYAFMFWSWDNHDSKDYDWLSAFGIWMKRSFFKIWKYIELTTKTENYTIYVKLDVLKWEQDPEWTIDYEKVSWKNTETWTKIVITKLNDDIKKQFQYKEFATMLDEKIWRGYPLFLEYWLQLSSNSKSFNSLLPEIIEDEAIKHSYNSYEINWVKVSIATWLAKPKKDSAKVKYRSEDNWWFISCNWRTILYWNKDIQTWWWLKWLREFHSSLNGFIWYVFLTSKDVSKLPWNTTKDWIVFENDTYQQVLTKMVSQTKPVVKYLASRYKGWDKNENISNEMSKKDSKRILDIVNDNDQKKTKQTFSAPIEDDGLENIQYKISKEKLAEVKDYLWENKSNSKIWEETFDYFYNREISDE